MLEHYEAYRRMYENGLDPYMNAVCHNPDSPAFEVYPDAYTDFYDAGNFVSTVFVAVVGYYLEGTRRYRDPALLEQALKTARELQRRFLHEDGSVDLRTTNYHDPSSCGFHVAYNLGPSLDLLRRFSRHEAVEDALDELLTRLLSRMGEAMCRLGFHTPNHRWVNSSALSYVYRLTGAQEALDTLEGYLSEGIDINEDGEYTERSAGCYNAICNHSFRVMAYNLRRPELLRPVQKNLTLMHSLFEADGSTCTLSSSRQDAGVPHMANEYFYDYLFMALEERDGEFAYYADHFLTEALADEMKAPAGSYGPLYCEHLYWFLVHPEWIERQREQPAVPPTRDRSVFLGVNGMARLYRGNTTLTLLKARHPDFLSFHYGTGALTCRFAGAFFGDEHSQFHAKELRPLENGGFLLLSEETCGYRSQLPEPPATSVWKDMDHSRRTTLNLRRFGAEITVLPIENGFSVDIVTTGEQDVPTKFEIVMKAGGRYDNPLVSMYTHPGDYLIQKDDACEYHLNREGHLRIRGGACDSSYARTMRGSVPGSPDRFTVCMTGSSPIHQHYEITYQPW